VERIRLDEHILEIDPFNQPLEHSSIVVLAGREPGLISGYTQSIGVKRPGVLKAQTLPLACSIESRRVLSSQINRSRSEAPSKICAMVQSRMEGW